MDIGWRKMAGGAAFALFLWAIQPAAGTLELDRAQLLSGELWRIWTGHLVHANAEHFWINILSALIIYYLFFTTIRLWELLVSSILFGAGISVSLVYIESGLAWYSGLSGLLHALVVYFAIRLARESCNVYLVGAGLVWLKVLVETSRVNLGYEYYMGDMMIVTEAHLLGVLIGTSAAIITSAAAWSLQWAKSNQRRLSTMNGSA